LLTKPFGRDANDTTPHATPAVMPNRQGLTGPDNAGGATTTDALQSFPSSVSTKGANPHHQFFYLPKKLWSPRYESDFYSVTVSGHQVFDSPPSEAAAASSDPAPSIANPLLDMMSAGHHPAVYYQVTAHRSRTTTVVWRRYSHFAWLKRQWKKSPPALVVDAHRSPMGHEQQQQQQQQQHPQSALIATPDASFPSPCPFFWWVLPEPHREAFLKQRQDDLAAYLDEMLGSPGYPSHPATVAFLELQ
jgi:PX domain